MKLEIETDLEERRDKKKWFGKEGKIIFDFGIIKREIRFGEKNSGCLSNLFKYEIIITII